MCGFALFEVCHCLILIIVSCLLCLLSLFLNLWTDFRPLVPCVFVSPDLVNNEFQLVSAVLPNCCGTKVYQKYTQMPDQTHQKMCGKDSHITRPGQNHKQNNCGRLTVEIDRSIHRAPKRPGLSVLWIEWPPLNSCTRSEGRTDSMSRSPPGASQEQTVPSGP